MEGLDHLYGVQKYLLSRIDHGIIHLHISGRHSGSSHDPSRPCAIHNSLPGWAGSLSCSIGMFTVFEPHKLIPNGTLDICTNHTHLVK